MMIESKEDEAVFKEILAASPRAAAIVATSYLADKLKAAVSAQLRSDKSALKEMFKPTGYLGSLGALTDAGYLLSLYSKELRDDLGEVAWIRNRFAHWSVPVDFAHKEIKPKCANLGLKGPIASIFSHKAFEKPEGSYDGNTFYRYRFVSFIDTVAIHLHALATDPKHPRAF